MYTGMEIILTVQSCRIEFKTTIFFVMVLDIPPKYINLVLFLWQLSERARSLVSVLSARSDYLIGAHRYKQLSDWSELELSTLDSDFRLVCSEN